MYAPALRPQISQGDIFDQLPVARVIFPEAVPALREIRGVVLTDDCEYDKPNAVYALVAEVRLLKDISENSRGNVKYNKTLSTFYLPASDIFEESYVDFRRTYQVDKNFLVDRNQKFLRYKSLTDEARLALQRQLSVYFGYKRDLVSQPKTDPSEKTSSQSISPDISQ